MPVGGRLAAQCLALRERLAGLAGQTLRLQPRNRLRQTLQFGPHLKHQPRFALRSPQRGEDGRPQDAAFAGMPVPVGMAVDILQMNVVEPITRRR
jgi:hypothetical protein